jgi:hypothetical protein
MDNRLNAAMMMFQYTDYIVVKWGDDLYKVKHFPNGSHRIGVDFEEFVTGEKVIDFAVQYLKTGSLSTQ